MSRPNSGSITSPTSATTDPSSHRFSALLQGATAGAALSSSSGQPLNSSAFPLNPAAGSASSVPSKRASATGIYDRALTKTKGSEVSLGAFAFLFAEIIRYTQARVDGISEFEKKLNILGYRIGVRLLSLTLLRDTLAASASTSSFRSNAAATNPPRMTKLLPALSWIHTTLWRIVTGKVADALEISNENTDEYMISDNELLLTRAIAVPKEMSQLSCGALMAGIVEACMDGLGMPARVTSHAVPSSTFPHRTTVLIKFEAVAMQRIVD